jgi:hypothetical protein
MTKADLLVERGAAGLEGLSRKAAAKGGFAARFADDLAEDAAFLRQLKPSLIRARAKGQEPKGQGPINRTPEPGPINRTPEPEPKAPTAPRFTRPRRKAKKEAKRARTDSGRTKKGPNPFLVAGVALATGIVVAKVIDWRSHAHPRD